MWGLGVFPGNPVGLSAFIARGPGLIPGGGTNFPQATQCYKKKRLNIYNKGYLFKEYLHTMFYLKIIWKT